MTEPGRVVLISGGSRGLGQELVTRCLEEGYRVATFSRSATAFVERCRRDFSPDQFLWEAVDGTDYEHLARFVRTAADRFGRFDALVPNVGTASEGMLALLGSEEIRHTLQTNLESVIHLTRQGVREMLRQGSGCVVYISSVNAIRGHAGLALYSATKAALDGMTRSLARELGEKNIRVNSVAPGYFESQMTAGMSDAAREKLIRRTPLKRLGTAAEVAAAVSFLLSDDARFITGHTLVVDGGLTC